MPNNWRCHSSTSCKVDLDIRAHSVDSSQLNLMLSWRTSVHYAVISACPDRCDGVRYHVQGLWEPRVSKTIIVVVHAMGMNTTNCHGNLPRWRTGSLWPPNWTLQTSCTSFGWKRNSCGLEIDGNLVKILLTLRSWVIAFFNNFVCIHYQCAECRKCALIRG